jgi:phospholipid/cholesterol/gamma-HCH transport system permease protein
MLVIISAVLGILGGKMAAVATGIVSTSQFDKGLFQYFKPYNVFFALIKAYSFSFIIASISSYYGYYVNGGALEIGRASTKSVVVSCVLILFTDYILSAILL